ncbi:putative deoxyribonuclease-2 [Marinobacterium zhoushanense]|uniref:Deoxyribonuclease-2 n=1 Tax=Marinobacterium zhoushanense TaxID=1679163 RepID=A0ABQ1KEC1_9GAMM|nr:deoxyribonuclease II family protein [Marinobacterium zhoushanense]GGB93606.1 putative deoxyribonuclease-2 [Marinobacterium zhoushanense]
MITAQDQQGKPVDWWFIYKTPEHTGRAENQGFDFLYFDPNAETLALSPEGLNQDNQALGHTLSAIFNTPESAGYISYNDEHVVKASNSSEKGHCKGILAFDKASDSALFLLHSTPRFPASNESTLPADEEIYGQTFICITLPDYQTANAIAEQMLSQQNPQILAESSRIPRSLQADEPLSRLFHGSGVDESSEPSTLKFNSRGGQAFTLIAKSRLWGKDFWLDLISPELNCDLIVETWRRGAVTPEQDGLSKEFDEDTLNLNFKIDPSLSYEWHYTKDHAKWAVALKNSTNALPWVCVADLNRMVSQEKRGGASLCFQQPRLWQALRDAEEKLHQLAQP